MRQHAVRAIIAAATLAIGLSLLPAAGGASPARAVDGTVHFTAAGDYSTGSNFRAVLRTIDTLDPDLHLALGDLSYSTAITEQAWCDQVTAQVGATFPFELIAGNHESDGQDGDIDDFAACLPNRLPGLVGDYGKQWFVDVPAVNPLVRFVMVSAGLTFPGETYDYSAGGPRFAWTEAAIDGARAAAIPWVVVGTHKPCLSTGVYLCESGSDLFNLLLEKKVDLVLHGHDHLYQRTRSLALSPTCPSVVPGTASAACIADSDANLEKDAGTVFATVGTGGIVQRPVNTADEEWPYFAAASGLDTSTWGVLDVKATATSLTARFARASGGGFSDSFTIGDAVAPGPRLVATDTFERAVASGFGTAELGGAWTAPSTASVAAGAGRLVLATKSSIAAPRLTAVSSTNATTRVTERWDRRPNAGGGWFLNRGRIVTGAGEYRLKVAHKSSGAVAVRLVRTNAAGTETSLLTERTVPGLTYAAGTGVTTLLQVVGTNPTRLRAKVWATTALEPVSWLVEAADSTAGLQAPGHTGIAALLSSSTTNGPVTVQVDDYAVSEPN